MVTGGDAKLPIFQQLAHNLALIACAYWAGGTGHVEQDEPGIADRGKEIDPFPVGHMGIEV